jgi:hypothetical protein
MYARIHVVIALLAIMVLAGCQPAHQDGRAGDPEKPLVAASGPTAAIDAAGDRSPGKPTAPVSIHYDIVGNPIVGQPVSINLAISTSVRDRPVTLNYRVNDTSAMLFPQSQAQRIEMSAAPDDSPRMQQVTVVPQREGRLFLNVSAEVDTDNGTMFRSLAIPIQVGAGTAPPAVNGEVQESGDGETVISLPASESGGS